MKNPYRLLIILIITAFFIAGFSCSAPSKPSGPVSNVVPSRDKTVEKVVPADGNLLAEGERLYQKGQPEKAVKVFEKVLEERPDSVPALSWRGRISFEKKLYKQALKDFDRVLELAPDDFHGYLYRGNVYYEMAVEKKRRENEIAGHPKIMSPSSSKTDDPEEEDMYDPVLMKKAVAEYEKARKLSPDNPMVHYSLGQAALHREEPKEAIRHFTKALKIEPDNVNYLMIRGTAYRHIRELEKAKKDLEKALKLEPDRQSLLCELGAVYLIEDDYNKALEFYTKAIDIDPDFKRDPRFSDPGNDTNAYIVRGIIYSDLCMYDKAEKDFEKASQFIPDSPRLLAELAYISYVKDRKEAARDYSERFLKKAEDPETAPEYCEHAIVNSFMGNHKKALELVNRAREINPNIKSVHIDRGIVNFETGNLKESKEDFIRAAGIPPAEYEKTIILKYLRILRDRGVKMDNLPEGYVLD